MRLIDADALPVCKEHCIDECGFGANFYVVHKTDIDAAPTITIEAEPVKHGAWMYEPETINSKSGYRCSICGAIKWFSHDVPQAFKFCPSCGAKMENI